MNRNFTMICGCRFGKEHIRRRIIKDQLRLGGTLIPIVVDEDMPKDEVRFEKNGVILGRIVGIKNGTPDDRGCTGSACPKR